MKNVLIYVRNKELTPSSYYRIVQYSGGLNGNIKIREIAPNYIYKLKNKDFKYAIIKRGLINPIYFLIMFVRVSWFLFIDNIKLPDCIIVSKSFFPRYLPSNISLLLRCLIKRTKIYWDFDDNIFQSGEISDKQKTILEKYSKKIIVTNNFLRDKIKKCFHYKVIILPTTDGYLQGYNKNFIMQQRLKNYFKEIRLVWVATGGNIKHLLNIIEPLELAAKKLYVEYNKQLILNVVCDKKINYNTKNLIIKNITWTREIAKTKIYEAHIGIMPLIDDEYTQGKGGFKLVQYISAGLPVIASAVGYNEEIVDEKCGVLVKDDENMLGWVDAILELSQDKMKWIKTSEEAYLKWCREFSFYKNRDKWNEIIQDS